MKLSSAERVIVEDVHCLIRFFSKCVHAVRTNKNYQVEVWKKSALEKVRSGKVRSRKSPIRKSPIQKKSAPEKVRSGKSPLWKSPIQKKSDPEKSPIRKKVRSGKKSAPEKVRSGKRLYACAHACARPQIKTSITTSFLASFATSFATSLHTSFTTSFAAPTIFSKPLTRPFLTTTHVPRQDVLQIRSTSTFLFARPSWA